MRASVFAAFTAVLEATGLRFGYGRGPIIIEDVDLTLQQGEIVGLFGASGSGKSTILRLLAGLERPRAGCVRLDRGPVTGPTRAIGLMFQSYALFDWATSLDNIRFAMRMAGLRPTRTACVAQLEKVGLAASADALPGALSGGMRQRLALARAMSVQPRVLLLDEPFSALDSGTKATVMVDTMRHIRENGLAAMIVSHDPRALIPHCDRALMLVGSPASLARSPTVPDDLGPLRRSGASDPARVNLGIASAIEAVINGGRKERS